MNVGMKRDVGLFDKLSLTIKEGEYYDIVTPYGYGGFVVEGNDTTQLESEYMLYCRNHNITYPQYLHVSPFSEPFWLIVNVIWCTHPEILTPYILSS